MNNINNTIKLAIFISLIGYLAPGYSMESSYKDEIIPPRLIRSITNVTLKNLEETFKKEMSLLVSDEEAIKENSYFKTYTKPEDEKYKMQIKLAVIYKQGLKKKSSNLRNLIETYWEQGLTQSEVDQKTFWQEVLEEEKNEDSMHGEVKKSNVAGFIESYYRKYPQKPFYQLQNIINTILFATRQYGWLNLDCEAQAFYLKNMFTEYAIQSYAQPEKNRKIAWCKCPKVTLADRMISMLLIIDSVMQQMPISECSETNPVIYTSFGSGNLLQDYITIFALNRLGYNYFMLNCIDKTYGARYNCAQKLKQAIEKKFNKLAILAKTNFYSSLTAYSKDNSSIIGNEHVIVSIDPGESLGAKDKNATCVAISCLSTNNNLNQRFFIQFADPNKPFLNESQQRINVFHGAPTENNEIKQHKSQFLRELDIVLKPGSYSSRYLLITDLKNILESIKNNVAANQKGYRSISIEWKSSPRNLFTEFIKAKKLNGLLVDYGVKKITKKGDTKLF